MTDIDKLRYIISKNEQLVAESEADMFNHISEMKTLSATIEKLANQRTDIMQQIDKLKNNLKDLIKKS